MEETIINSLFEQRIGSVYDLKIEMRMDEHVVINSNEEKDTTDTNFSISNQVYISSFLNIFNQ